LQQSAFTALAFDKLSFLQQDFALSFLQTPLAPIESAFTLMFSLQHLPVVVFVPVLHVPVAVVVLVAPVFTFLQHSVFAFVVVVVVVVV
jgi:hypothetical protein